MKKSKKKTTKWQTRIAWGTTKAISTWVRGAIYHHKGAKWSPAHVTCVLHSCRHTPPILPPLTTPHVPFLPFLPSDLPDIYSFDAFTPLHSFLFVHYLPPHPFRYVFFSFPYFQFTPIWLFLHLYLILPVHFYFFTYFAESLYNFLASNTFFSFYLSHFAQFYLFIFISWLSLYFFYSWLLNFQLIPFMLSSLLPPNFTYPSVLFDLCHFLVIFLFNLFISNLLVLLFCFPYCSHISICSPVPPYLFHVFFFLTSNMFLSFLSCPPNFTYSHVTVYPFPSLSLLTPIVSLISI